MGRRFRRVRGLKFGFVDIKRRWNIYCLLIGICLYLVVRPIFNSDFVSPVNVFFLILAVSILIYILKPKYHYYRETWERNSIDSYEELWSKDGWTKKTKKQRGAVERGVGRVMFKDDISNWIYSGMEVRLLRTSEYYYVFRK